MTEHHSGGPGAVCASCRYGGKCPVWDERERGDSRSEVQLFSERLHGSPRPRRSTRTWGERVRSAAWVVAGASRMARSPQKAAVRFRGYRRRGRLEGLPLST